MYQIEPVILKQKLNDAASMIKNSSYVPTPHQSIGNNNHKQEGKEQDIVLEQDPTYLPKTNNQKQRSMAGAQGSIMAPLSPGMEGKVAEEDWMDILLWISNACICRCIFLYKFTHLLVSYRFYCSFEHVAYVLIFKEANNHME